MTTRTFISKEELMIALLQGEKWGIEGKFAYCYYQAKKSNEYPFWVSTRYTDGYEIFPAFSYCDGKTLWHKVEEKPKKKTVTIIKFYSSKGKILEMDKSKLTQMPKNIIDEYELEVYDE